MGLEILYVCASSLDNKGRRVILRLDEAENVIFDELDDNIDKALWGMDILDETLIYNFLQGVAEREIF